MPRWVIVALLLALLASSVQASVISYLRFEENGGGDAWDETGLLNGELLNFGDTSPGGGDTGFRGWSTSVASLAVPLTGQPNTSSIRFAGGAEFIDLSNGHDLSLGTTFTIEFFMKPENPIAQPIFGFAPVSELYLMLSDSLGDLYFNMEFMDQMPYTSATGVQTGIWQHVALVKDPGEYGLYLDGNLLTNATLSSSADGPYFFPGTDVTGDRTIGGNSGTWRGWLDEFRISDEALTPDQFLNYQIPEPSTFILTLLGLATWWAARRKHNHSRRPG